jgi:glucose/mannose-6-phosphate isomerase
MCKIYDDWPKISQSAYESNFEKIGKLDTNHIVFAGMGGSGSLGDTFASILSQSNIHVSIVKGYHLPKTVDSKSLVITTSISGNTQETIKILADASKLKCSLLAISSGGQIEEFCMKNNVSYRKIPEYHSPRASFCGVLYSMLNILEPIIPISKNEINNSILQLKKMGNEITTKNLTTTNKALNLAKWITGIPVIYYPWGLQSAAIRFKNSLQENSKIHAFAEDVVESSHNGIVPWERRSNVQPILLQGANDHIKTKERWEIFQEYFESKKIEYQIVKSSKGHILSKIINLVYLLDYCSIYKAILLGIDPSIVTPIDFIKKRLPQL